MLLDLKKTGKISDSTYKMLNSSDGLCPRFYSLPKVHKPGIQLRPIASFVNSPTSAISGYHAKILSPVVGNTDFTVKNSCEFAHFIREAEICRSVFKAFLGSCQKFGVKQRNQNLSILWLCQGIIKIGRLCKAFHFQFVFLYFYRITGPL